MTMSRGFLGYMYLGRLPCGRVAAASWSDTPDDLLDWLGRGLKVERVERYTDDPQPEWICTGKERENCKCLRKEKI